MKETHKHKPKKESERRFQQWGGRLFALYYMLLLLAAGIFAWTVAPRLNFFLQQATRWPGYPYFQAGSEGLILNEVSLIRQGGSIYIPLQGDQFISAPYPPLYYYLLNFLWPVGTEPAAGFTTGRLISLVAAFITAIALALLVLSETRQKVVRKGNIPWLGILSGLAVGVVFLSLPAVGIWATRVRADMLMTAFGIVGLVLVAWKPREWPAFVAILPLTLALYTKQTAIAAPAACGLYIILQNRGNWRRIVLWVGSFVLAVGLPFGLLNLLTGFELYRRLFKYHNLPWLYSNFQTYWELFTGETAALLWLAVGLTAYVVWLVIDNWRHIPPSAAPAKGFRWFFARLFEVMAQVPLAFWYLIFSMPLLLGLGVSGADHNHFLPAEAALCAAGGLLVVRLLTFASNSARWQWGGRGLGLLAAGLLIWQVAVCSVPSPRYEIELRSRPDDDKALGRIIANAAANPTPYILTSEAGFFVLTGKPTTYNDLFTLAALTKQGLYNNTRLLERVRQKEFGLILAKDNFFKDNIRSDVWTPDLVEAIREGYNLKFSDVWFTYEPKP